MFMEAGNSKGYRADVPGQVQKPEIAVEPGGCFISKAVRQDSSITWRKVSLVFCPDLQLMG